MDSDPKERIVSSPLPTELPASLGSLSLDNNFFSGRLPPWPYLNALSLENNKLEGSISSLCQSTSLQLLVLSNNKFTGQIPHCLGESLRGLQSLNLGNNGFSGTIPSSIRFLTGLTDLELSNNGVSGEPLLLLENCTMLSYVDLAENRFTGIIPHWIGDNLPTLIYLRLRSNMFSGQIPTELAKLQSLQILDLASNDFSGAIPANIGNISAMASSQATIFLLHPIDLHVYSKGQDMYYRQSPDLVNSLDLSSNSLVGDIPEGIGDLASLGSLNLSRNRLTGKIPQSIGGLALIESLDLSMNLLSGNIPESLSSLTFLSYLNLSYNNLSGEIPSGHQLQTLEDPSIYMNNPYLCGPPVSKSCSSNVTVTVTESGEKEYGKNNSDLVWQCISTILGFVMGFWIFCGVIFFKDRWRHAYFSGIDKLFDETVRWAATDTGQVAGVATSTEPVAEATVDSEVPHQNPVLLPGELSSAGYAKIGLFALLDKSLSDWAVLHDQTLRKPYAELSTNNLDSGARAVCINSKPTVPGSRLW
ncbi:receptor-like protein EIX2 [Zingiber officinale]|uniref:receptor-like protein EIX2 n=1 Tax=Zingiber officinale TaxID=94328 RepID=UPI001C4AFEB5|nr:receptor-like protein EIX2 [Zingiber officinale]